MGSLGDKFKKLAGDQTRQLLQNFQNAQSSKTRNGYSYGKLNEDGTATLADGTVVQVEVKGRPGQYAPVFNLGNGQGLVDQPEAKFFTVDGGQRLNYWGIRAVVEQQHPPDFYNNQVNINGTLSGEYYFNYMGITQVKVCDLLNQETYYLDENLWRGALLEFPIPSYTRTVTTTSGFGFTENVNFTGGPITRTGILNSLGYSYSGLAASFSDTGRDILLFQVSDSVKSESYQYSTVFSSVEANRFTAVNTNVGAALINYRILRDWYIEDDIVKCVSIQDGTYTLADIPVVAGEPLPPSTIGVGEGAQGSGLGTNYTYRMQPMLTRSSDGSSTLNLMYSGFVTQDVYSYYAQTPIFNIVTLTRSVGQNLVIVRGINTDSPTVTYRVDSAGNDDNFFFSVGNVCMQSFRDSLYGAYANPVEANALRIPPVYRSDTTSGGPVPPPVIGPGDVYTFNRYYLSDSQYYDNVSITAMLSDLGLDIPITLLHTPNVTQTVVGTTLSTQFAASVGVYITDNSWSSFYRSNPSISSYTLNFIKVVGGESGLSATEVGEPLDNSIYDILLDPPSLYQGTGETFTYYSLSSWSAFYR